MRKLIDAILFPLMPLLEWWEGVVFWVVFWVVACLITYLMGH